MTMFTITSAIVLFSFLPCSLEIVLSGKIIFRFPDTLYNSGHSGKFRMVGTPRYYEEELKCIRPIFKADDIIKR